MAETKTSSPASGGNSSACIRPGVTDCQVPLASNVVACQLTAGGVYCVSSCSASAGEIKGDSALVTVVSDADEIFRKAGKKCTIVAVLPKTHYVTKWLRLPEVPEEDVGAMVCLEIEALLPSEFGPAEISYRVLFTDDDGVKTYEVYASRQDDLGQYQESLAELGIVPQYLLPSAFLWRQALEASGKVSILVSSPIGGRQVEVATVDRHGHTVVRTVERGDGDDCPALERHLHECVRIAIDSIGPESLPISVGWIGADRPETLGGGIAVCEDMANVLVAAPAESADVCEPAVHMAATLLGGVDVSVLSKVNLVPREVIYRQQRRVVYRRLWKGVAIILLAIVMCYVSLRVAAGRLRSIDADLSEKIAEIETEGEKAGRTIKQLSAVAAARRTSQDFFRIIEGLEAATPDGVSFSHIELTDTGEIRLRGQAKSMSLPFLLIEKFEKQPVFRNVKLHSAGQKTVGAGSITQFRLDCKLSRRNK